MYSNVDLSSEDPDVMRRRMGPYLRALNQRKNEEEMLERELNEELEVGLAAISQWRQLSSEVWLRQAPSPNQRHQKAAASVCESSFSQMIFGNGMDIFAPKDDGTAGGGQGQMAGDSNKLKRYESLYGIYNADDAVGDHKATTRFAANAGTAAVEKPKKPETEFTTDKELGKSTNPSAPNTGEVYLASACGVMNLSTASTIPYHRSLTNFTNAQIPTNEHAPSQFHTFMK